MPRTRLGTPLILNAGLETSAGFASHDTGRETRFPIGTRGVAMTDLHPSGTVRIGNERVDAISEGGFVDHDATVVIVGWSTGTAVVRGAEESGGG